MNHERDVELRRPWQTARAWTLSGTDCTRGILGASLTVRSTRTSLPCVTTRLVRYCGVTDLISDCYTISQTF
ncbi:hypothetical protein J6590_043145 [Homalodisca vitripennis]|nr:hypothetical protein J6590_043145 [Homalodisca vitripennis]